MFDSTKESKTIVSDTYTYENHLKVLALIFEIREKHVFLVNELKELEECKKKNIVILL